MADNRLPNSDKTPRPERQMPVPRSDQRRASSAHARINVPLNLQNWSSLPPTVTQELLWYHQWLLDNNVNWQRAADALGYSHANVFKILKGTYGGNWDNVATAIQGLRRIELDRATIQRNEFAPNTISRLIYGALGYAMANNSVTTIIGESRLGKTVAATAWAHENNHGRSVFVTVPPIGGVKALAKAIATRVGVNKNLSLSPMLDGIYRAFNAHRILIVDEAHRCLPNDTRTDNPPALELLRDIHDQTKCALALISTKRLPNRLEKGSYQYEQLIGRIGLPVLLPTKLTIEDVEPIIGQYVATPSAEALTELLAISNQPGRLGIVVETLKVASRLAATEKRPITNADVINAIALRRQMMGITTNRKAA